MHIAPAKHEQIDEQARNQCLWIPMLPKFFPTETIMCSILFTHGISARLPSRLLDAGEKPQKMTDMHRHNAG